MKFYVYQNKRVDRNDDTSGIFFIAESILSVWGATFDPDKLEYTGISINAKNSDEASKIYLDPALCLEHARSDAEPNITKIAAAKKRLGDVSMELLIQRLAKLWLQIDDMLRAMADVYVLHNKDMTKEQAYKDLKERWLKKYLDRP